MGTDNQLPTSSTDKELSQSVTEADKKLTDLQNRLKGHQKEDGAASISPAEVDPSGETYLHAADFLTRLLKLDTQLSVNYQEKRPRILLPSGAVVLLESSPINPDRFPLHGVSFVDLTFRPGMAITVPQIARQLQIDPKLIINAKVRGLTPLEETSILGEPEVLSDRLSLTVKSDMVLHCNDKDGYIYLYPRKEILEKIGHAIKNSQLRRVTNPEKGSDRIVAYIPFPKWCFRRDKQGLWHYEGKEPAATVIPAIREYLSRTH